jgi:uncharacterized protein
VERAVTPWPGAAGVVRPGWGVLAFVLFAVLGGVLVSAALAVAGVHPSSDAASSHMLWSTLPSLCAGVAATWTMFKEPTGLRHPKKLSQFAWGLAIGALTVMAVCAGPALVGASALHLNHRPFLTAVLTQLVTVAPAGLGEELLLRGLGFQALRRGLGDWPAVLATSVVFGALHLFNPHASAFAAVMVALVGVWFGLVMVKSGSVFMPMGLHVGWNFFEGAIFGQPVSGQPVSAFGLHHHLGARGRRSRCLLGPDVRVPRTSRTTCCAMGKRLMTSSCVETIGRSLMRWGRRAFLTRRRRVTFADVSSRRTLKH